MGVPKFYRWLSERYPCLSEVVKEYQIPEFDNLYLDMNGIIHICSHPDDGNPHFRITEEKIFKDVFHYIEVLFRMIKPKKVFYMAVDGVAPRAKMNQQRGRRFRSAKEAENLEKQALAKGEVLPEEKRFDSNCITPGTKFMVRLQEQLKYFVVNKVSTDKLWQGPKIYLSGHQTPGEGEHKVMDFIRSERAKPDYDPNTRHCLYGLDADLIMLGMVTHDPHFSLLREEVRFGGKNSQKRSNAPEQTTFHLLHLQLLREYLDFEFSSLRETLPFAYDLESIIDDWVLMGFLVGNDFIPHLPQVHIHGDALPLLWATYKQVLPTLDGYINESGKLNLPRFEKYMQKLSEHDTDQFRDTYADLKWLESKVGDAAGSARPGHINRNRRGKGKDRYKDKLLTANQYMNLVKYQDMIEDDSDGLPEDEGMDLISFEKELGVAPLEGERAEVPCNDTEEEEEEAEEEMEEEEEEDEDSGDEDSMFRHEFRHHKDGYYMEKLKYEHVTPEILRDQAEGYVRAIQWILYYYFDGVPSWSWYYPHHYAPYISDVRNFSDMKIEFELGRPFLPFEQLMAVLPAASKENLPEEFYDLMTDANSAVIDYYPVDFETDLNGKMQEWEAVVLIPFINEERLLKAMVPIYAKLRPEDAGRNCHGPHFLYQFTEEIVGTYPSSLPSVFPDVVNHHAMITEVDKNSFVLERSKLRKGLCEGVKLDVFFPGFPTLKHIPHKAHLEKAQVKVFQMASRNENMIVEILENPEQDLEQVAHEYLGRAVYVNWPHMEEARVIAVSDGEFRFNLVESSGHKQKTQTAGGNAVEMVREELDKAGQTQWNKECDSITERYKGRRGVDISYTSILIYACPMVGRKYVCGHRGNITLEKQWSAMPATFCLQATVKDIAVKDPGFHQYHTLDHLFPVKCPVFMLGSPHYGCMGEVLEIDPKNDGRIRVDFTVLQKPALEDVMRREKHISGVHWYPGYVIAQKSGVSNHLVSRITGTIYITKGSKNFQSGGKSNVGLNLKFTKKNEEVPGYTKKEERGWLYSQKVITVIQDYIKEFPELFDYINKNGLNEDIYFENEIFGEGNDRLRELGKWLKEQPCSSVLPVPCGSYLLDEHVISAIEEEVQRNNEINQKRKKHIKMQVRPKLLYRPLLAQMTLVPDTSVEFELYDRVINVRDGYSVPLGLAGTVIGIHPAPKDQDTVLDIVFDEEFLGGLNLRCSAKKGYRVPISSLINLSHGERKELAKTGYQSKPIAFVKPQAAGYQNQHGYQGNGQESAYGGKSYNNGGVRGRGGSQGMNGRGGHRDNRQLSAYQQLAMVSRPQGQGHELGRRPAPAGGRQDDNGYANMWQQLQAANLTPTKASQPAGRPAHNRNPNSSTRDRQPPQGAPHSQQGAGQNPKTSSPQPLSLAQAALALDKAKLPISKYQKQQKQQQKESTNSHKEDEMEHGTSEEFLSLMKALEVSNLKKKPSKEEEAAILPTNTSNQQEVLKVIDLEGESGQGHIEDQQNKEGTAALYQMLKIGQPSKDSETSKPDGQGPTQDASGKSYGKQVSIQELFNGAKQHNQPFSQKQDTNHVSQGAQQKQAPPPGQRQPIPGMAAPQPHPQQGAQHQGKRSRVAELQQWCGAMGMPPPRYDYSYGIDKRVNAVVTLATGLRYQGSMARNLDQAAESAASNALLSMQKGGMKKPPYLMAPPGVRPPPTVTAPLSQPQQPPRGAFCSSPNSAFTPVVPTGKNMGGPPHHQASNHRFHNPSIRNAPPPHQQHYLQPRQMFPNHPQGQGHRQGQPQGHFPGQGHGPQPGWGSGPRGNQHRGQPHHGNHHQQSKPMNHNKGQQGKGQGSWDRWPKHDQVDHGHGGRDRKQSESERQQDADSAKTPTKNQFVPLQVMRKQKTPQRDVKPESSKAPSESKNSPLVKPAPVEASHKAENLTPASKLDSQPVETTPKKLEKVEEKNTPPKSSPRGEGTKQQQKQQQQATPKSAGGGKRKQRSRLAANFGTPS